jgi:hypothetical protein
MREKERLLYTISRFDQYYNSINSKCAVFLAYGTFLNGGLVASYPLLSENFDMSPGITGLYLGILGLGIITMLVILKAATPFAPANSRSVFYFKSIADQCLSDFAIESEELCRKGLIKDLRQQTHGLSKGLEKKFRILRTSGHLLTLQLALLLPFIGFLILNTK